uniref:NADH dehydrogenase [ubiquinone] 1 alpha subcomplex subunit 11 n=1 Tax=Mycena chlorophos TaxID=658473 RepID=A0ABQ0KZG8_MYCCL|nr:predicted protein [Mycena chlorophos]
MADFAQYKATAAQAAAAGGSTTYQPASPVAAAFNSATTGALGGVIAAGLRNSLTGRSLGWALPIGAFAAVGGVYAFSEQVVANIQAESNVTSVAAGACSAGFLLGIGARSLPVAVGACGFLGAAAGLHKFVSTPAGSEQHSESKKFFKPTAVLEQLKQQQ